MEAQRYVRTLRGPRIPNVIVDAVHATAPRSDEFTREIVEGVVRVSGCQGIVALVSRTEADLNRPISAKNRDAIHSYRAAINSLLEDGGLLERGKPTLPILHLAIHGMRDDHGFDVAIGTRDVESCGFRVREWIVERLTATGTPSGPLHLNVDQRFPGDPSKVVHRRGDEASGYAGYGQLFHTVQLEWSRAIRLEHRDWLIQLLAGIANDFAHSPPSSWEEPA